MSTERIPDFQDEVKHKLNDTVGTVIAVYTLSGSRYLDVRVDRRIYYMTPAANWTVTVPCDE